MLDKMEVTLVGKDNIAATLDISTVGEGFLQLKLKGALVDIRIPLGDAYLEPHSSLDGIYEIRYQTANSKSHVIFALGKQCTETLVEKIQNGKELFKQLEDKVLSSIRMK